MISLEWAAANALTRVVYAELRPATRNRPLFAATGETPAQVLGRFASACNVPLTAQDAETVYRDGLLCELWSLVDGVLVLDALPPSVREARALRPGAKGGMSPAQKQQAYRDRIAAKKAGENRRNGSNVVALHPSPLPPANGNADPSRVTGDPLPSEGVTEGEPLPVETPSGSRTRDSLPLPFSEVISTKGEGERTPDPERAGATPPTANPTGGEGEAADDWSVFDGAELGLVVIDALRAAGAAWSDASTTWEIKAFGELLQAQSPAVEPKEVALWVTWLRECEWRKSFHYANHNAGLGSSEPLTVKLLLGAPDKITGQRSGAGLNILRATGVTAARKHLEKNKPSPETRRLNAPPVGAPARATDLAGYRDKIKKGVVDA